MNQGTGEILDTSVLLDRSGIRIETDRRGLVCYFSFTPSGAMPKLSETVVRTALKKAGVVFGLLEKEISELDGRDSEVRNLVIARGSKASLKSEPHVKYHFSTDPYSEFKRDAGQGQVDYRERGRIPYVKEGAVLATITVDVAPTPGTSILGAEIPPEFEGKGILRAGANARLEDDRVVAAIEGGPRLDPEGRIEVQQEWFVNGDVDIKTGNIYYPGPVRIKGVIQPGFEVHAQSVKCLGIENKTVVESEKGIEVDGGIQGGRIICGGRLETRFINNAEVISRGDVEVRLSVINSEVRTSGALNAQTIFGGTIAARLGITCINLSSDANRSTVIFGLDPIQQENVNQIVREKIELEELLNQIKEKIGYDELENWEHIQRVKEEARIYQQEQEALTARRATVSPDNESALAFFDGRLQELEQVLAPMEKEISEGAGRAAVFAAKNTNELMEIKRLTAQLDKLEKTQGDAPAVDETLTTFPKVIVKGKVLTGTRISSTHARLVLRKEFTRVIFIQRKVQEVDRKKYRGKEFFMSVERL